ncbi:MAG: hypothetical protein V2A73_07410 [Pseudomonadota bacterium]
MAENDEPPESLAAAHRRAIDSKRTETGTKTGNGDSPDDNTVVFDVSPWPPVFWLSVWLGLGYLAYRILPGWSKVIGVLLLLESVKNGWRIFRALRHRAGMIAILDDQLVLSPGRYGNVLLSFAASEVKNAYVLRMTVPWLSSGPFLVVETTHGAHTFPRSWFRNDHDQRFLAHLINHWIGKL